ncbi:hypothetical protein BKA03_000766 [Demequina lutea]|uniref:Uncharacterized protein n=1 Tax=Demequina lutea TaxID=431489 RepID=A0A7Y9Z884_9MICO|nr:hypothetical protein [Demequina lutea]
MAEALSARLSRERDVRVVRALAPSCGETDTGMATSPFFHTRLISCNSPTYSITDALGASGDSAKGDDDQ